MTLAEFRRNKAARAIGAAMVRVAILLPDKRLILGELVTGRSELAERKCDAFLDHVGRTFDGKYPAMRVRPISGMTYRGGQPVRADRYFLLEPSENPFDVYWPQGIAEQCGCPCFGEEYA